MNTPTDSEALPRTTCSRSDSERLDWLQSQIDGSGYSVVMQQGVTNDGARQRTTELRAMVGSGPWQTLHAKHNLRAAIDAAISSENNPFEAVAAKNLRDSILQDAASAAAE